MYIVQGYIYYTNHGGRKQTRWDLKRKENGMGRDMEIIYLCISSGEYLVDQLQILLFTLFSNWLDWMDS